MAEYGEPATLLGATRGALLVDLRRAGGLSSSSMTEPSWFGITRRNARSVQTTIGWIFWDPGAVARFEALGLPGPIGYLAARCAPLAAAGPEAVIAALGTISPLGIRMAFELLDHDPARFAEVWAARDEAVVEGLHTHAPAIVAPLSELGPTLWPVVEQLPLLGRTFFGAHLAVPRPEDPLLSGWHAVNCIREWRGDTHWAIVAAAGLTPAEASILHNAWLGYEDGWLPRSRGQDPAEVEAGWEALAGKGLAHLGDDGDHGGRVVRPEGIALRQRIEDETDERTTDVWRLLGREAALAFPVAFEPPCEALLRRVDVTAGPNYQPASRIHPHLPS